MRLSKQGLKSFGLQLLLFLLMFVVSICMHELAHAVVAWWYGVPWSQIQFDFRGIDPRVTYLVPFTGHGSTVFDYAGGLVAGFLVLVAFVAWLKWSWSRMSLGRWFFGGLWVVLFTLQFYMGYLEGHDHTAYLLGYQGASAFVAMGGLLVYVLVSVIIFVRRNPDIVQQVRRAFSNPSSK